MRKLAYVCVAALGSVMGAMSAEAGVLSYKTITDDASTSVGSAGPATHAVDLNEAATTTFTINTVVFTGGGTGDNVALKYNLVGPTNGQGGNATPTEAGSGISNVLADFHFGSQTENLTLSGLLPNTSYIARFFVNNNFSGPTFTFSTSGVATDTATADGTSLTSVSGLNRNAVPPPNPQTTPPTPATGGEYFYSYTTGATDTSITFNFVSAVAGDSFHQYGFSNEIAVPEPASLGLMVGGVLLLGRRRRLA